MQIEQAVSLAVTELNRATALHGAFHSAHEGYSVIKEEFEELWDEIKKRKENRNPEALKEEAVQLAAMALRFIVDCVEE